MSLTTMKNILFLIITISFTNAYAQKLPNVQQVSMRAPDNVKIDGKATEWDNKWQAYNKGTGFFYNIANNAGFLYIVIRATDAAVTRKIIGGGISLTISAAGRKTENAVRVTYPILAYEDKKYIDYKNTLIIDGKPSTIYPDSMITTNNKNLLAMSKTLSFGKVDDRDNILSVYNDYGIQAAMLFNNKMELTVELALDLKLLKRVISSLDKLTYHVECNGMEIMNLNGFDIVYDADGTSRMKPRPGALAPLEIEQASYTTDFFGEYTMAKFDRE